MSAERLIKEFGAQDVGAWLTVVVKGEHKRVAHWNNANNGWDVLPEGHNLLNPPVVDDEAPKETQMERMAAKSGLRKPKAVEKVTLNTPPSDDLDLS